MRMLQPMSKRCGDISCCDLWPLIWSNKMFMLRTLSSSLPLMEITATVWRILHNFSSAKQRYIISSEPLNTVWYYHHISDLDARGHGAGQSRKDQKTRGGVRCSRCEILKLGDLNWKLFSQVNYDTCVERARGLAASSGGLYIQVRNIMLNQDRDQDAMTMIMSGHGSAGGQWGRAEDTTGHNAGVCHNQSQMLDLTSNIYHLTWVEDPPSQLLLMGDIGPADH